MPLYILNRGESGPQSLSVHLGKKKISYTYRQSNQDFSVVQTEAIAVQPKLSWLLIEVDPRKVTILAGI